ncbi:RAP domain protein [Theileria parva strain Muguga]|uniref:RAP domain protein n=1 Tax=Theileria parva strain Muguga TaxID=333668 RepID=UPI001C61BFC9|nr:RAP domain protein [Theileria parva strain Muguga]KAF5153083.1 RAP domain protein [Theileria parva strain Muguga]
MNRLLTNVTYKYFFRFNFKNISTFINSGNDPNLIKTLTPKQLGRIAFDVSKCANSDIRIWDTFVQTSQNLFNSFDYKDTLRVLRGLNTFYDYLNYDLRRADVPFLANLLDKLYDCCESYNCTELSEVAEIISTFIISNQLLLDSGSSQIDPWNLLCKISISFKIRLAEATPSDIVRLLVSFSKVGSCDNDLLETLVQYSITNKSFTLEQLRTICASCVILNHYHVKLLDTLCESYINQDVGINDLAILSFIFSNSSYTNRKVIHLFEKNLKNDVGNIDLPSFCLNLHKIGVKVPEDYINLINVDSLKTDTLINLLVLFSKFPSKQIPVLNKLKSINLGDMEKIPNVTEDYKFKILEYIANGSFTKTTHDLFNLFISEGLFNSDDTRLIPLLTKLPVHWILENFEKIDFKGVKTENVDDSTIIQTGLISFLKFCNDGLTCSPETSKMLMDKIQNSINEMERIHNISHLDTIFDMLPAEELDATPHILINQIRKTLNIEIQTEVIQGKLKIFLIKGSRDSLFLTFPEDFLSSDHLDFQCSWIPPGKVPRLEVLSKMYYITSLNYNITPISHYAWNKILNKESKLNYLPKLTL